MENLGFKRRNRPSRDPMASDLSFKSFYSFNTNIYQFPIFYFSCTSWSFVKDLCIHSAMTLTKKFAQIVQIY